MKTMAERSRDWRARNPNAVPAQHEKERFGVFRDKYLARKALENAITAGKLERPPLCSECHRFSSIPIEAHHLDYGRPLDVVWLCRACHVKRHKAVI